MGEAVGRGGRIQFLRQAFAKDSVRAAILSLLVPGLGHAYLRRFGRALIWLAGLVAIAAVIGGRTVDAWIPVTLGAVLSVFAAADAVLIVRADSKTRAG